MNIKKYAEEIISSEISSLEILKKGIDINFEKAVNLISKSKGRLIVSGIGKSAHIANKIVATLNSTGTSSIFLHATEAIHGDLGMIRKGDVILIISKSGESAEVTNLISALKNFDNKIIGMVANENSTLAKNCNIVLNTYAKQEVCPYNLAPTNSTTCQLVLGDAIAITLMKINRFTDKDFAKFHPGGALGKKLSISAKQAIEKNKKPQVSPNDNLRNIIFEISQGRLGATAVIGRNQKILGIITDGDIRRILEDKFDMENTKAKDVMTQDPKVIDENIMLNEAIGILNSFNITQLIVVNSKNVYTGMLHIHDIIKEGIQ